MIYKFYRVVAFEIAGPHKLSVSFDDGSSRVIDFSTVLVGRLYEPLRDLRLFEQVRIDPEVGTLIWPNGADFNPAMLHDWNSNSAAIARSAAEMDSVSVS